MQQINLTLGTAGHIDHGKTALVKCLTGCETDRLKEEKERGMSIELGFAPCRIADMQVGIVDVPGHENFIKTMVAGATGMDAVILVVAADDGVMPQTREHLEILTLLGIRQGIVALTKIDRIPAEQRDGVAAEVGRFLHGTFLDGAPVLPVSNITGEGFDRFLESLWAMVRAIQPKRLDGIFRLPLERAFSVQGYGTVLAGIPLAGSARAGDEVVLLPQNLAGRIRRIEVYGQESDVVRAGQCAAINVGHWDHRLIHRGDTLTLPRCFSPQEWYVCSARLLPREKLRLKSGAEVRFHTGTSDVAAMFYPLKGNAMEGGAEGLIQVRTKTPLVAGPGDPFLLRTSSPVRTIGGGRIVEATDRRLKGSRPHVFADLQERAEAVGDEGRFVEYCVRRAERLAVDEPALVFRTKIPARRVQANIVDLIGRGLVVALPSKLFVHRDTLAEAVNRLVDEVRNFHQQSPEHLGLPVERLRQSSGMEKEVFDGLLAHAIRTGRLIERNQCLALPEHRTTFQEEDAKAVETIESLVREKEFAPPGIDEIIRQTGGSLEKTRTLIGLLRERGALVQVEEGLWFHRQAVEHAREILMAHFQKEGRLESVQFKYLLNTTRKYALPLLDYLDWLGATRRVGNTRYPRETPPGRKIGG